MFNFTELVKNNTTSAERTSDKKNALKENKTYIQIAQRAQRGKNYINAIVTTSAMQERKTSLTLNKKLALALTLAYASDEGMFKLNNIVVAMDGDILNGARDYIASDNAKQNTQAINETLDKLFNAISEKQNALK